MAKKNEKKKNEKKEPQKSVEEALEHAEETENSKSTLIIGIGASAGGLEALQQFFTNMSDTSNLAFVVIQHLSPDYKSLLAEILAKNTKMPVVQAENQVAVEPNHVYLIPPKNNMILKDGKLHLTEYNHGGINHPIDIFLASLAEEMKGRSIAIILSGTGTDGTSGIKAIKEQGGLIIVQDPVNSKFDGMPKSAINTGLVDFVLTPRGIAEEILNFSNYPTVIREDDELELFSDEEMLTRIYLILKKACKIDYTHYKRTTLLRRIERRMVVNHKENLSDYLELLNESTEEARMLGKEILIGVTNFFRDAAYFDKLKAKAIYDILENSEKNEPIRVWVAGCSTGEEAYSIAILFAEAMDELSLVRDVKIFATDVDTEAIEFAGKGLYTETIMDDVSTARLNKFFHKKSDHYQISKDIRKMVIFAPHNVFQDPPFGRLDLISCRNVMIYFQPVLQKNLCSIFHNALKHDGFLFLGKSETAGEYGEVFVPVCGLEKIYRHNTDAAAPDVTPISYTTPRAVRMKTNSDEEIKPDKSIYTTEESYLTFLETFLPPAVIIDEKNDIVHSFGEISEFMHLPRGKAVLNIFNLVGDDLSLVLSTALNKAHNEKKLICYTDVQLESEKGKTSIDLTVQPIVNKKGEELGLTAVVFNNNARLETAESDSERYDINKTAAQRIIDLEHELQESQENLKATIGELETVNEELQAANEELLTANEELQSSNEELQSVNEELYTVNTEYQQKLEELTDLNNDMSNFLSSTMIGILFVDNSMNIRKFTDYVAREFNILEHDIGRPIQLLSHNFENIDINEDASNVLKTLMPIEREAESREGKHYTMRISPYRTTDNTIKGLVITIIDSLSIK